ncbi:hypothetical protein LB559_05300 [Mesorhizobium sp. BR1-1-3]|uniref:hypothetical protein n=1 Tax=Mesorhizobium sp. BR1-1-3 TaxID=2876651 RepID=UPI001CD14CC2|nr:hypothetical protein [Mesorhizobium sp. BR1-1-3]MBZ9887359.1 hypothetical protein [Mesorhizobium sp. BR1-1-3]
MADLREKDGERSLAIYDLFDRVGMWRVHRDAAAVGAGISRAIEDARKSEERGRVAEAHGDWISARNFFQRATNIIAPRSSSC